MADPAVVKLKMDRAKTKLVLKHPFFSTLLMKYPLIETTAVPTMGVDTKGKIYYNPDFVATLSEDQIVFGLAHEVMHRVGMHAFRKGGRDMKKWNYATDAWINDMLRDAKVGEWIPHIVDIPGSKEKICEQIYADLPDSDFDMGGLGQDLMPGTGEPLSEEEQRHLQHEAQRDLAEAAAVAQMRGMMPGSLRGFVDSALNPTVPWYKLLERWMSSKARTVMSWARPNRRFMAAGHYLPSYDNVNTMGPVGIVVDVSGSISNEVLGAFAKHVQHVIDQVRPTKVIVAYVDSTVAHVDEYEGEDIQIELKPHGGGGTDMRVGLKYLHEHEPNLEAAIVLTDMYTPFPSRQFFPTFWAATTDVVAPHEAGETVKIEVE